MKFKIAIATLALAASVVAQQTTEKPSTAQPTPDQHKHHLQGQDQHAMHGQMKCCKMDEKGEMKCPMMSKASKMKCCKGKESEAKAVGTEKMSCCKGMMAKGEAAKMECCKTKNGEAMQCGKEEKPAAEKPTGTIGELPAKS